MIKALCFCINGPSWPWLYGCRTYIYLWREVIDTILCVNSGIVALMIFFMTIPLWTQQKDIKKHKSYGSAAILCARLCNWFAAGRWFSLNTHCIYVIQLHLVCRTHNPTFLSSGFWETRRCHSWSRISILACSICSWTIDGKLCIVVSQSS
jgi:hypothetical protein